jgi:EF hand
MKRSALVWALVSLLTACSSSSKDAAKDKLTRDLYTLRVSGAIVYSPNGEPLSGGSLGHLTCVQAISAWFDRVDANHRGFLDKDQVLADSRIQFLRMDLDGDGAIYPAELKVFREPFQTATRRTNNLSPDSEINRAEEKRVNSEGPSGFDDKAKRKVVVDVTDLSDPVMSADANLDFKVTLPEFLALAQDNFRRMDLDHDGKLQRHELISACPPPLNK